MFVEETTTAIVTTVTTTATTITPEKTNAEGIVLRILIILD